MLHDVLKALRQHCKKSEPSEEACYGIGKLRDFLQMYFNKQEKPKATIKVEGINISLRGLNVETGVSWEATTSNGTLFTYYYISSGIKAYKGEGDVYDTAAELVRIHKSTQLQEITSCQD